MRFSPALPVALVIAALALLPSASASRAEEAPAFLLTIFLRHDQTRSLDELQAIQKKNGFNDKFPPRGIEVVSWYVMMGIGQVVTLKVPPDRLREVNLSLERGAWGAFKTDFYPTYDFRPVWEAERARRDAK